jgi:hypothetical protein
MALSIVDQHCSFEKSTAPTVPQPSISSDTQMKQDDNPENAKETSAVQITLVVGAGNVVHNGKKLERDARVVLAPFDRIVLGNELMLFRVPGIYRFILVYKYIYVCAGLYRGVLS